MFCSGCGTELNSDLNYCNRCGSRVAKGESSSVAENLSQAIAYIGGFGLLGFIFAVYLMMRSPVIAPGTIVIISFLYLATLFGICFMILRQTAPFAARKQNEPMRGAGAEQPPASLRPVTTAQLGSPTHEPISVTEHTTRALEETPAIRK